MNDDLPNVHTTAELKPDEIRRASFSTQKDGFSPAEVTEFLEQVAGSLEVLLGRPGPAAVRAELERVSESTSRIIMASQEAAERLREQAHQDARTIVEEASAAAEKIRKRARQESLDHKERREQMEQTETNILREIRDLYDRIGATLYRFENKARPADPFEAREEPDDESEWDEEREARELVQSSKPVEEPEPEPEPIAQAQPDSEPEGGSSSDSTTPTWDIGLDLSGESWTREEGDDEPAPARDSGSGFSSVEESSVWGVAPSSSAPAAAPAQPSPAAEPDMASALSWGEAAETAAPTEAVEDEIRAEQILSWEASQPAQPAPAPQEPATQSNGGTAPDAEALKQFILQSLVEGNEPSAIEAYLTHTLNVPDAGTLIEQVRAESGPAGS